jgi:hypothetical protein
MRKYFTIVFLSGLVATALAALPIGEKKVTADGNIVVEGSSEVSVLTDGEALVSIRRGASRTRMPSDADGDTAYTVVGDVARTFRGTDLKDVYVDLVGATYAIVTWR